MADYLSIPIFDFGADFIILERIEIEKSTDYELIGEPWQSQRKYLNEPIEELPAFKILLLEKSDRKALRDHFALNKGMVGTFWIKSGHTNMVVQQNQISGTNQVLVKNNKDLLYLDQVERHIWLERTGQFFKISSSSGWGPEAILIILSDTLSSSIVADDPIQNLYLVRYNKDVLRIESSPITPGGMESTLEFHELQRETP